MVHYLRPGDVAVIAKASRLGTTRSDRLQTMAAITKRGASIYDADTGEGVQLQPKAIWAMASLDRAESGFKRELAARMQAWKVALSATGLSGCRVTRSRLPRPPGLTSPRLPAMWRWNVTSRRERSTECLGRRVRFALAERTGSGDEGTLHTSRDIHQPFAGSPLS
jgi:hypothetical protein